MPSAYRFHDHSDNRRYEYRSGAYGDDKWQYTNKTNGRQYDYANYKPRKQTDGYHGGTYGGTQSDHSGFRREREDFVFRDSERSGSKQAHRPGQEKFMPSAAGKPRKSRFREHLEDEFEEPRSRTGGQQQGISWKYGTQREEKQRQWTDGGRSPVWLQKVKGFVRRK